MNAKSFLAATASLALAAAPAVSSARSLPITVYGYTGSTTLENFPVLVRLSPDTGGFDYADCAPDGSDIRFADAAGNLIPHEIDTWNPSGESAIWVALPTLERGTAFSMLFGSDAPTASAPGSVWSGAGYASVWHLDVDANGATTDSVSSYAGSVQNPDAVAATGGAGIVGGAYHCESNLGVHSVKTAAAAGFAQSAGGEATLSVWFRQIGGTMQYGKPDPDHYPNINWASQYGNCGVIVNSKNGGESGPGVELGLAGRADNWRRLVVRDSAVSLPDLDTESLYDKRWHHLAVVWDGTTRTLYLDGVPQSAAAAGATYATPSGTVRFGARDDGNKDCVWTGDLDEVRFLPSAASADWIAAEHAQLSSASFLHVGTGHRVVAKSLLMKVCGYTGSTSLERFPVLVRLTPDMEGFDYADCLPNGSDIRFTDAAGNLIPHEFDVWDPNGDSAIWVAVPTLEKGTEFKMLYGPGTPAAAAPGGVWSGAGYASVWHMDIDAADGYSTTDSAGSFRGTVHDPNAAYAAGGAGVVGGAYHCESNGGVHGVATTAAAGFTQSAGGEATLSVWFRQIGGTMQNGKPDPDNYPNINWGSQYGNCGVIVNSKNGGESGPGVELCLAGYANNWKRLIVRDSAASRPDLDTESLYDKRWHHLAVVWDGTTRTLYLDGAPQPAATAAATYGTPFGTVRMGFRDSRDTNCVWTGDIDEVRFLPSAASADWIAAEHAQVSSDSFLKVLRLSGTVIIVR